MIDPLSYFILALTILRWPLRLVMIPVVIRHHKPSEGLAWLTIIFFEPFIGLAIYLVVGRLPTSKRRIEGRRRVIQSVRTPERVRAMDAYAFEPEETERHHHDLVAFSEALTQMPIVRGNASRLITSTPELMREMAEAIANAKHHVHLMTFILVNDESGAIITRALREAADRGVTCRVLADYIGSKAFFKEHASVLAHKNIELRSALRI